MNWVAFTAVIGLGLLLASFCVGIDYVSWQRPQWHKTERNVLIILFGAGLLSMAVSLGLGIK